MTKTFGAFESEKDSRTIQHDDLVQFTSPLIKGGVVYNPEDIENQHSIGICTAISMTQNRQKRSGRKYSADFQYLLQKKFYDLNWVEGSAIFYALKVAKNYGFLPLELWTHTTEQDRYLPYSTYIAKLQAIPDDEIQRLISLCIDKIAGYASVDVSDAQSIAKAINDSGEGILCRYSVGREWYSGLNGQISYLPKDIDPIRPPEQVIAGHAIGITAFDYTEETLHTLCNTWGTNWCCTGNCHINWDGYKMTEAWIILESTPAIPLFQFKYNLSYGMTSPDVKQLQIILNKSTQTQVAQSGAGSPENETKFFGVLTLAAVKKFQKLNSVPNTGFVGTLTRDVLNALL